MKKGTSQKYPKIVAGQSEEIIDNMFSEEFGKVIKRIDKRISLLESIYPQYENINFVTIAILILMQ